MRSRLWRCSLSQLRPALPAEILGKEIASDPGLRDLLHQVMSSSRVGAVAVDKEGPPGPEHDLLPVHQGDGAGELSEVIPPPMVDLDGGAAPGLPSPPPGLEATPPVGVVPRRPREEEPDGESQTYLLRNHYWSLRLLDRVHQDYHQFLRQKMWRSFLSQKLFLKNHLNHPLRMWILRLPL